MLNQELVDFLKECGVCQVCQLRYLQARGNEYQDARKSFESLNVKYQANDTENIEKKSRSNTCTTCLGLFSAEFQEELLKQIFSTDVAQYETNNIVLAISMPMLLQIRNLSIWYALLRKFDDQIDPSRPPDVAIKEAVKLIINPIISEKLKKQCDANGLMINITLTHSQEEEELAQFSKLHKEIFCKSSNGYGKKKKKELPVSRTVIENEYSPKRFGIDKMEEYLPIPPTIPNENLCLQSITLTGPIIYIAGRYRKITRELSHTPWILNGNRVMEDSIEEFITRIVAPYFCKNTSKIIFMSSGREDVDVRCLGKGRPFVLEIPDAFKTTLPKHIAYKMERAIEETGKISVQHLQVVQREDLVHIKSGEEEKRKYYRALCKLNEEAGLEILEKLNFPEGFEIQQKTPLRVLHRRPLHTRPRQIYSLKAWIHGNNPKVLILDIVSQAGTYIKELVHGDFGRTLPSITSIIGKPIDILALDVVAIDLDWPKEIDNSINHEIVT